MVMSSSDDAPEIEVLLTLQPFYSLRIDSASVDVLETPLNT